MKALVYRGPRDVRVEEVPDAKIERPTDVLVRITSTNICGSDLHMYEGRTDIEPGQSSVTRISARWWRSGARSPDQEGRLGLLPFNVGCGYCRNCERGFTGFCLTMNPAATPARPTAIPGWGLIAAVRPNCSACPTATSTASGSRGRGGERDRLRDARRHLADRLARHRAGRRGAGRVGRDLRLRPGRAHGGVLGDRARARRGLHRGPPPRPPHAGGEHRRGADRRHEGRSGRAVMELTNGRAQIEAASASAGRRTTRRGTSIPTSHSTTWSSRSGRRAGSAWWASSLRTRGALTSY